jgi:DNA-binding GntR family transcriptional regulator
VFRPVREGRATGAGFGHGLPTVRQEVLLSIIDSADLPGSREPYSPQTVAVDLHRKLRRRLCEGGFMPGESLSIRLIAEQYDTSLMPAREAIRWLVAEGALEFAGSRKIIVPQVTVARFTEILFLRKTLEGEISERAFDHIDDAVIDDLKRTDASLNQAIDDNNLEMYLHNNYRFHFRIYRLGKAPVMLHLVELLWLQYGPSMRYCYLHWGSSTELDHHRAVTDALERGDRRAFRDSVEADIEQGMDLIMRG